MLVVRRAFGLVGKGSARDRGVVGGNARSGTALRPLSAVTPGELGQDEYECVYNAMGGMLHRH